AGSVGGGLHLPELLDKVKVVLAQLLQHSLRTDEFRIIVANALTARDIADRTQGRCADLADAFCDIVCRTEDFGTLIVQHQMVVAEMRTGNVPMKILGLEIEGKAVRQNG